MKTLLLVAALVQPIAPQPAQAVAQASGQLVAQVAELYSFNDVYRLTVGGAAMAQFPAAAGPLRVAVMPPQQAAAFSIREVPVPGGWLLLFSGLAAAFWVARRRLGYAF